MLRYGLTKARTMGPIAEAVSGAGGSLTRVFGRAGIPLTLLDTPDRLILLRDQVRLVEAAMREIGDPSLPARLSTGFGIAGLGPIGVQVRTAGTLGEALARVEAVTPILLQTATWTGLRRRGAQAFYGYGIVERIESGRQANEILALGYLLSTVRHFLGSAWRPNYAVVTGATLAGRTDIERLLGVEIALGSEAGLVLSPDRLGAPNPDRHNPSDSDMLETEPIGDDLAACVAHLVELGLDEARPTIDGIACRLGLSRRTLQRRLGDAGTRYADIQQRVMARRAKALLAGKTLPVGRIALELGYADAAHFTRAFLEWTGVTPSQWRRDVHSSRPARAAVSAAGG
ncbi:HTH-type transcriptional regulator VirS [Methylobacterium adhaesivum]|uniref:AraC family transcriptional regulator ligand-binding domain-containing protein n=1 Tax=Methylobacterium adhaesivum TaxID=333297 RepID=A0ABT8BL07_9HYPH|nr:AraC family transcriptional regulator [Methylobacterium adhaesivum]MDN3592192.1 AraC family transcriptional regulator ligand-binding domain-containing protein [Methylobacterium adhaesivum]GJD32553.1 HTH-type transcriptional regulator VirS [Methylobacterium adhaesivum]